jgi:hypothetical protein
MNQKPWNNLSRLISGVYMTERKVIVIDFGLRRETVKNEVMFDTNYLVGKSKQTKKVASCEVVVILAAVIRYIGYNIKIG